MTQLLDQVDPEREAFEALAYETLAELAKLHLEAHPDEGIPIFLEKFKILHQNPSVSGDEAVSQLERAQAEGKRGSYFNTALVVSTAYLAEARRAADHDRIGRAWHALAKACYWRGVMRSLHEEVDFTLQAFDAIRKAESGKGGRNRAANFAAAKKVVVELAHEFRPTEGWVSRREAVLAIKSHLEDLIPENPIRITLSGLSPDRWERTFSDWLGEELSEKQFRHLFPVSELPKASSRAATGTE